MAVEDHPRYEEWRAAYDRYVAALERYDHLVAARQPEGERELARHDLNQALAAYHRIADEIN